MGNYQFSFNCVSKKQIKEGIVCYSVPRRDVESLEFRKLDRDLETFKECNRNARGKLLLTFGGYDNDPSEIYEIMDIRKYVGTLLAKHPYLFYFLSSLDSNNHLILACLTDIESYTKGDKRHTLNEIVFDGIPRGKININFNLKKGLVELIKDETMRYGMSVGDREIDVKTHLSQLFDLTPKSQANESTKAIDIYELFMENNKKLWSAYTDAFTRHMIKDEEISAFADRNHAYIMTAIKQGYLSTPILVDKDVSSNVFIVNDFGNGTICKKCNTSLVLIVKQELEIPVADLEEMVFVPSAETYLARRIPPFDSVYLEQIPVPIDPAKDKWYCPVCRTLHSFHYSDELGLTYE